jgi:DNA-binding CsgD family transcriptional regulator
MKHEMSKTLLIAERSEVIRKGLVQIIGSFGLFDHIHEIACNSNIETSIIKLEPDVIIINPLLISPGVRKWLEEFKNGELRLAAFVYALFDEELKGLFDDVIQIGDTRGKIKSKIEKLVNNTAEPRHYEPESILSTREKDVVRLLAKGLSNKEISGKLFISPHTVITHRKNITRKLNIKSVAGLIVYAIINDIVSVDEMQQQ